MTLDKKRAPRNFASMARPMPRLPSKGVSDTPRGEYNGQNDAERILKNVFGRTRYGLEVMDRLKKELCAIVKKAKG